jgi:predicted nucleotidyltransferase component of viral defense system
MRTKPKGISIRQKLNALSSTIEIKYAHLETTFLIERLLARLTTDKQISKNLVFKGGYVGLAVYQSNRYTIDLDALLVSSQLDTTLEKTKALAETDLDDGVWFRFENQIDLQTQGEYGGVRQVYRAGIGEVFKNIKKAQIIHFDLGIGDPITPQAQQLTSPSLLPTNQQIQWSVYPIETIIAEKLHAVVAHGEANSRSKDIYDLAIFLPKADSDVLKQAIEACFSFRKTDLPQSLSEELRQLNTKRLKAGWPNAMASIPNPPDFDNIILIVIDQLETLGI